jgi:hypothetical protein
MIGIVDTIILPFFQEYTLEENVINLLENQENGILTGANRLVILILLYKKYHQPVEPLLQKLRAVAEQDGSSDFEDLSEYLDRYL